jgi:hypothetical protein
MNKELQYSLDFAAMVYLPEDTVWPLMCNTYSVSLQLLTCVNDQTQISVALERIKAFVYSELAHTVFINQNLDPHAEMLELLGANVTTLPHDPTDQIVGLMLFCKLNAVMEGRVKITQLDISSELGDSVWYKHSNDDSLGPFDLDGWWHKPTVQHDSMIKMDSTENVVRVERSAWIDYGLTWFDDSESAGNVVVYANFSKNENNNTQ